MSTNIKQKKRERNHRKIRTQVSGTSARPRLSVYKSNTAISAQIIDDEQGVTIVSARGTDAKKVGSEIAKLALSKKVDNIVFDRGGYIYTGKVKILAEASREAGLKF